MKGIQKEGGEDLMKEKVTGKRNGSIVEQDGVIVKVDSQKSVETRLHVWGLLGKDKAGREGVDEEIGQRYSMRNDWRVA